MSLRRIKHMFLRLSAEEKVIGIGGLLVIIGTFMPWFYIVLLDQSMVYNGFSGDLGIIGFVIFILVLLALLNLIAEHLHIRLPQFGYTKEQVLFFLMGQSAFLILLAIATYTKKSLDYTSAELRFGIYFVLVGAFLGAFAAFAQIQKLKKKEVTEFFEHDEEESTVETKSAAADTSLEEEPEEEEEERALFEEPEPAEGTEHVEGVADAESVESEPEPEEEIKEDIPLSDTEQTGEAIEDDIEAEVEEIIKEEVEEDEEDEIDQGKYFSREAGINSEADKEIDDFGEDEPNEVRRSPDSSEANEVRRTPDSSGANEADKKTPGLSMNFYEDQ